MNGISIIICCFNSQNRLPETIKHIFNLKQYNSNLELIIVDNASTDKTTEFANNEIKKYHKNFDSFIINEPNPGLNNARKKGAENAKYDWLLFCDDDNWLDSDYLVSFYDNLNNYPALAIMGCGISKAEYEVTPEKWFYKLQHLCAIFDLRENHKQHIISHTLLDECLVCGAGMFIKKALILQYFKDETFVLTGRTGTNLMSGEDTDITSYALKNNNSVGQFINLKLQHFIPSFRTKKRYLLKLVEGIAYSFTLIDFKYKKILQQPPFKTFIIRYINNLLHFNFLVCDIDYHTYKGKNKAYKFLVENFK
jgi:glycosyltransferase involved in cell wall biosynthesis